LGRCKYWRSINDYHGSITGVLWEAVLVKAGASAVELQLLRINMEGQAFWKIFY